jgi:hypothetical protein
VENAVRSAIQITDKRFVVPVTTTIILILSFLSLSVDATPQHDQVFAWYPNPSTVLRGFVDSTDTGGNTFRLSVVSPAGAELYKYEGEQYMGVAEYYLPPNREQSVLLVKWSSGNSFRVLVLSFRDQHVKAVNDLLFDTIDYSLMDVDGDMVPELITYKKIETKGQPVSRWPYSGEIYQWKSVGFAKMGSIPSAEISKFFMSHISGPEK